jgi:serine/threonine protein kinase
VTQPRTIGKYEILDVLGAGGMGTVYRAADPAHERIVAVKLLHRRFGPTPGSDALWNRFRTEARAVALLHHPTIVSLYDFSDTDPAGAFFVMEYVDGRPLKDYLRPEARLGLGQTLELMSRLLDGLGYVHAQDIVHRDIKPSNLLVTREGQLKITDFGIAKVGALQQTQLGMIIGTPEYLAPEQYTRDYIDPRCDLYAAGTLFFQLLAGRPPFAGTVPEIMYQVCHAMPAPVSTVAPSVPALLDPLIAKALAKDPDDRFQSAWHFCEAVKQVRQALGLSGTPPLRHPTAAPATILTTSPAKKSGLSGWVEETRGVKMAHPVNGSPPAPSARPVDTGRPNRGVSNETLDRTTRILIRFIGPIAAALVKRAAPAARDDTDLYTRLAERITDAKERERFLTEVRRPSH